MARDSNKAPGTGNITGGQWREEEGCGLGPSVVTSQHSSSARDAGAGWHDQHLQSAQNLDLSLMPSITCNSKGYITNVGFKNATVTFIYVVAKFCTLNIGTKNRSANF